MIEKEHCVYIKKIDKGILILSLYIDDILIVENVMEIDNNTREWWSSIFEMKDMGGTNCVLGMKIVKDCSK